MDLFFNTTMFFPKYIQSSFIISCIFSLSILFSNDEITLYEQTDVLISEGKYSEAIDNLIILNQEDPNEYLVQFYLGFCYLNLNELDKAEMHFLQIVDIESDDMKFVYYNLACISFRQKENLSGLNYLEEAFKLGFFERNALLEDPDMETVKNDPRFKYLVDHYFSKNNILSKEYFEEGQSLFKSEKYKKAIKSFNNAIKYGQKTTKINYLILGDSYMYIGSCYQKLEKYIKSVDAFQKSIPYYLEIDYNVGLINSYISFNYQQLKNYPNVIEYAEKAIANFMEINDSLEIANHYFFLGEQYFLSGDYPNARAYLEQFMEYDTIEHDLESYAFSMQYLAASYLRTGSIEKSLLLSDKLMELADTHNLVAFKVSAPIVIGFPLLGMGRFEEGLDIMLGSLNFLNNYEPPDPDETLPFAKYMVNAMIGYGYIAVAKKFEPAIPYFETAFSIAERDNLEDALYYYLRSMETLYVKQDIKSGLKLLEKAVKHPSAKGTWIGMYPTFLNELGMMYYYNNNIKKAYDYLFQAYDYSSKLNDSAGLSTSLIYIATCSMLDAIKGENNESLELAEGALSELIEIFETVNLNEEKFSKEILDQILPFYELYAMVLFFADRGIEALAVLEDIKSRNLKSKLLEIDHHNALDEKKDIILSDNEILIGFDIINNSSHQIYQVEDEIMDFTQSSLNLDIEDNGFDIFVQTFSTADSIFWDQKDTEHELFSESMPTLDVIIKIYNNYLKNRDPRAKELSSSIYKYLFSSDHMIQIKDKTHIIIMPDPLLSYLPFETLIDENGKYLIETYDISYIQSEDIYSIIQSRENNTNNKLIAFGGVVYNISPDNSTTDSNIDLMELEKIVLSTMETRGSLTDIYFHMGFSETPYLPFTLSEVQTIGKIVSDATIITGRAASENKLKEMSNSGKLAEYNVLHFSTHGFIVPEISDLSALVLAADDNDKEDGYLNAYEIMNLDIKADFVNLSACETGLGKIYKGEGVVGLTQAFLIAGTNAVSVTLWPVADESTSIFMIEMYKTAEEMDISYLESMSIIKRQFIRGKFGEKYKDPYYWSPFVYYGK